MGVSGLSCQAAKPSHGCAEPSHGCAEPSIGCAEPSIGWLRHELTVARLKRAKARALRLGSRLAWASKPSQHYSQPLLCLPSSNSKTKLGLHPLFLHNQWSLFPCHGIRRSRRIPMSSHPSQKTTLSPWCKGQGYQLEGKARCHPPTPPSCSLNIHTTRPANAATHTHSP